MAAIQDAKTSTVQRPVLGKRVLRWLGAGLLVLALAAFGYELWLALQTGSYRMLAAGELWYALDRGSLNLTQAVVQRYLLPALWDPVIVTVLLWPAWALLGAPGAALLVASVPIRIGRQPRQPRKDNSS